jgi:putative transcriptional regulator
MDAHNNVRATRLKQNLTQESLADMVDVTRQTIIAIEKEKFVPSVKLALQLARALHTPFGKLFWLGNPREGER